ncbi:MAG TPA: aldo/keto reductase [Methylomirabilota bacterium]|jgi:L-galactose dehydrogenase/L-glyceraldehyde 3-phosphate reductase|nr:aldo/keto reductase [Methylomirabilota bacterium]
MELRALGRTGLRVSALGFGCGNVGGLLVRGTPAERERAVARGLELGITYFDTASIYGDGLSEQHLGQALRALGAAPLVGTKVRLAPSDLAAMPAAIERSTEASLRRLGMERVDLMQFHNPIAVDRHGSSVSAKDLLETIVPALARLVQQGKARFFGVTALGDTRALLDVVADGRIATAQVCLNLLNPTAAVDVARGFPAQDFGRLLPRCRERGIGTIVIRVAAGGALSGVETRHPIASPPPEPIASGADYASDVRRARQLQPLVDEGHVESLIEASLRFAVGADGVSTVLLGYSSLDQLEYAAACVAKGPLPAAALTRLRELWAGLAGA